MRLVSHAAAWLTVAIWVAGCGNSEDGSSGTSGATTTGAASSGGQTSTGSSATGSGTAGTGSTGTGTTGTTTAGSNSSGSSSAGTGATGSSSGSTTGDGYKGFDSGPRPEPSIDLDAGCCALFPFASGAGTAGLICPSGGSCWQCRNDADCPSGRYCNADPFIGTHHCEVCHPDAGAGGCPSSELCIAEYTPAYCIADCRDGGLDCRPGVCSPDTGFCLSETCFQDSDCLGFTQPGGGICDSHLGVGECLGCAPDGGGCPAPAELCYNWTFCAPSCVDGGYQCQPANYCDTTGFCLPGCLGDSDCIGATTIYGSGGPAPFCQSGSCAQCRTASDCPNWRPGCNSASFLCGGCDSSDDCPTGLTCDVISGGWCGCFSSSSCSANFPNQPVCVPLGDGGNGACVCRKSSDCGAGQVCEVRPPYQVQASQWIQGFSYSFLPGGACIQSCVDAGADYCSKVVGLGNNVCDQGTGYCVPCEGDSDCKSGLSPPIAAPTCIPFPGGDYPNAIGDQPLPTGGGQCGCISTSACDDGFACNLVAGFSLGRTYLGACQAPCTYANGVDSCQESGVLMDFPGYCNTWTGLCAQCLNDYDCTGMTNQLFNPAPQLPFATCTGNGYCAQCTDASQCPANLPGCSSLPKGFFAALPGACGFCTDSNDCLPDAGFVCAPFGYYGITRCMAACLAGDDAGMGTVSDAGPTCPAALPYCVAAAWQPGTWCSECRTDNDCTGGKICCGTYCNTGSVCPN